MIARIIKTIGKAQTLYVHGACYASNPNTERDVANGWTVSFIADDSISAGPRPTCDDCGEAI